MTDFVQMIEWAFGGFWRFCGFALLLAIVSGTVSRTLTTLLVALKTPSQRR